MTVRTPLAVLFSIALAVTPAYAQIVLPGGGSGGGGSGVSSIATNCPIVGAQTGAVTLNGYLSNSRTVSTTSDTLLNTDCGGVVQYTNSGSIAVAIAASGSTGFTAPGYWVGVKNSGSGTVTVTPATGTINGNATLTVSAGADVQILAFGSGTYITMNGAGSGGGGSGTVSSGTGGDCANYPSTGTTVSSSAGVPCPPQFSQVIATYHPLWPAVTVSAGVAATTNTAVCSPFIATLNQHWDQIVTRVSITGSSNDQFAIYPDGLNATSGAHQPVGAATYSSGNIANTGSVGNIITWALGTSGVGQAITQGPNWICFNSGDSTGAPNSITAASTYVSSLIGAISSSNAGSTLNTQALKISQTFGTWPTFTTSSSFTEVTNATSVSYAYRIATTP